MHLEHDPATQAAGAQLVVEADEGDLEDVRRQALDAGSDYLVIGRPITRMSAPAAAASAGVLARF